MEMDNSKKENDNYMQNFFHACRHDAEVQSLFSTFIP